MSPSTKFTRAAHSLLLASWLLTQAWTWTHVEGAVAYRIYYGEAAPPCNWIQFAADDLCGSGRSPIRTCQLDGRSLGTYIRVMSVGDGATEDPCP